MRVWVLEVNRKAGRAVWTPGGTGGGELGHGAGVGPTGGAWRRCRWPRFLTLLEEQVVKVRDAAPLAVHASAWGVNRLQLQTVAYLE